MKKVYGGMLPGEARELKQLRDEDTKLKRLVADLSLDKVMLRDVVQKNSRARQAAWGRALLDGHYGVSQRRAARAARFCRSSLRYESRRDPLPVLRHRLRELAQSRVRFGYRRILVMMHREGLEVGKHRV